MAFKYVETIAGHLASYPRRLDTIAIWVEVVSLRLPRWQLLVVLT